MHFLETPQLLIIMGQEFCPGTYTIKATTYSGANLTGTPGTPLEVTFQLNNTALFVDDLILVDAGTDTDIGALEYGAAVDLPVGGLSIRSENDDNCVRSVRFMVKDTSTGEVLINRIENLKPHSLLGDVNGVDYLPWES